MVNREELIAYLLHQMPEEAREAFNDRWIGDPELYEQLRQTESELLDGYARQELDAVPRAQIETYLLTSEHQRQKLAFAGALQAAVSRPGRRRDGWRLAALAAAAVVLLAAGLSVWLLLQNRQLRNELSQTREAPRPAPAAIYVAALSPDTSRGTAQTNSIALPAAADLLRFDLELEPGDENGSYTVMLSSRGVVLWKEEPLRAERRGAAFVAPAWIPRRLLQPGAYEVQLSNAGTPLTYYHFTIAP